MCLIVTSFPESEAERIIVPAWKFMHNCRTQCTKTKPHRGWLVAAKPVFDSDVSSAIERGADNADYILGKRAVFGYEFGEPAFDLTFAWALDVLAFSDRDTICGRPALCCTLMFLPAFGPSSVAAALSRLHFDARLGALPRSIAFGLECRILGTGVRMRELIPEHILEVLHALPRERIFQTAKECTA